MGFERKQRAGRYITNEDVFVCDTADDINNLPTTSSENPAAWGSWAEVISNGSIWRLNSSDVWVRQPQNTGGGSTEVVSIVEVETSDYLASYKVYQGEVLVGTINVPLPTIADGSIGTQQLSSGVNDILSAEVTSAGGAHKIRYYNDALEVKDNNTWKKVKADGLAL